MDLSCMDLSNPFLKAKPKENSQSSLSSTLLDQLLIKSPGGITSVFARSIYLEIAASVIGGHLARNLSMFCDWTQPSYGSHFVTGCGPLILAAILWWCLLSIFKIKKCQQAQQGGANLRGRPFQEVGKLICCMYIHKGLCAHKQRIHWKHSIKCCRFPLFFCFVTRLSLVYVFFKTKCSRKQVFIVLLCF